MILRCVSPSGKVCTIRVKADGVISLAQSLKNMKFHEFYVVPEYSKFHTLGYVRVFLAVSAQIDALNSGRSALFARAKQMATIEQRLNAN